jgi:hypothetical protein
VSGPVPNSSPSPPRLRFGERSLASEIFPLDSFSSSSLTGSLPWPLQSPLASAECGRLRLASLRLCFVLCFPGLDFPESPIAFCLLDLGQSMLPGADASGCCDSLRTTSKAP